MPVRCRRAGWLPDSRWQLRVRPGGASNGWREPVATLPAGAVRLAISSVVDASMRGRVGIVLQHLRRGRDLGSFNLTVELRL
jgi:hypothetical protein